MQLNFFDANSEDRLELTKESVKDSNMMEEAKSLLTQEIAILYVTLLQRWEKSQPLHRYALSLTDTQKFLSKPESERATEEKQILFHLRSLEIWLDKMEFT